MDEWGRHPNGVTVSFRRRQTGSVVDGFESVTYGDWFDVKGCAVKYALSESSEEDQVTRDSVFHGVIVYGPPMDSPPGEYDKARLPNDPDEYKVKGRPVRWKNPFGSGEIGTEIRLERVAG